MLYNVILIIDVVIAVALVGLVLLQQGKGADVGAAFGSGASSTVFGSRGSGSFLTRTTGILATLFFAASLSLAYLATENVKPSSVVDRVSPIEEQITPDAVISEDKDIEKPASDVPVTE